jgi:hypothetical protein
VSDFTSTLLHPVRIESNGYAVTFRRNPACYPYLRETRMYLFLRNGVPNLTKFEKDGDHIVGFELPLDETLLSGHHHLWCRVWKFNPQDPYFEGACLMRPFVLATSLPAGRPLDISPCGCM